jgi:ABC-2 type transport system permease protein
MTRLVVAEFRRIAARRLFRLTILLAFVGIAAGGLIAYARSGSLDEGTYQQRVAEAETRRAAEEAEIDACLRANGVGRDGEISDAVAEQCFPAEDAVARVDDPRFHRDRLAGVLKGVSGALAVIGWGLGASLVGAEFASRSMTTLLTWEPRRGRVFVAKIVAVVSAISLLAVAVLALVALSMWPALAFHGAPIGPDDPTVASLAGMVARGVALTAVASGIGFAIATIGRNTAAALGAGFAYVIVLENILGSSLEDWRRWLLLGNVIVFITGENNGGDVPGRSVAGAGLFLAAVAIGLLAAAAGTFRTRDLA